MHLADLVSVGGRYLGSDRCGTEQHYESHAHQQGAQCHTVLSLAQGRKYPARSWFTLSQQP
jgi:hypothetical protein